MDVGVMGSCMAYLPPHTHTHTHTQLYLLLFLTVNERMYICSAHDTVSLKNLTGLTLLLLV